MPGTTTVKGASAAKKKAPKKKAPEKSTAAAKEKNPKKAVPAPTKPRKRTKSTGKAKAKAGAKSTAKAKSTPPTRRERGLPKSGRPLRRSAAPIPAVNLRVPPAEALVVPAPSQPGRGDHIDLGIVAGSDGPTARLGAGATDLCEISPSGLVAIAGDTFTGNQCRQGDWSPSLALHVKPNTLAAKVEFDGSFGWNSLYADGWGPGGRPPGGSQLPAGTVQVHGVDYLLVTRTGTNPVTHQDLTPIDSRLVVVNPDKPGWPTVPGSLRNAAWEDGNQTQISGCQAPDGFVYIIADSFQRDKTLRLYRCPAMTFTDRNSWRGWGMVDGDPKRWAWDQPPSRLNSDLFGELSLRMIEGRFVLSAFNQTTGKTEVRVAEEVEQVAAPWTPCTVVVDQRELPRNYGGYIVPGSTLDQCRVLVSQWGEADYPYNVREYVVNLNRNQV